MASECGAGGSSSSPSGDEFVVPRINLEVVIDTWGRVCKFAADKYADETLVPFWHFSLGVLSGVVGGPFALISTGISGIFLIFHYN